MANAKRGFAAMTLEQRTEIATRGGHAVPAERRSFSTNRKLAAAAGAVGGIKVPAERRSFFLNRELAREAGSKGGKRARRSKAQDK